MLQPLSFENITKIAEKPRPVKSRALYTLLLYLRTLEISSVLTKH